MRTCTQPECTGQIEPQRLYICAEYSIAETKVCTTCRKEWQLQQKKKIAFKEQVDFFHELININYHFWTNTHLEKWGELVEVCAQHILKSVMPGFEIIQMDTGNINNQYDLLAKTNNYSIAIEVTEAVNQQAIQDEVHFDKMGNSFKAKTAYNWFINFKLVLDISKIGRNKIEQYLCDFEAYIISKGEKINKVDSDNFLRNRHPTVIQLTNIGAIRWHGELVNAAESTITLNGPMITNGSPNPASLFRTAYLESKKPDNLKKLTAATTNEKHLFVIIGAYIEDARFCLNNINSKHKRLSFDITEIEKQLATSPTIPDLINIVWLANIREFNTEGKISFRLAKIISTKSSFMLESITEVNMPFATNITS